MAGMGLLAWVGLLAVGGTVGRDGPVGMGGTVGRDGPVGMGGAIGSPWVGLLAVGGTWVGTVYWRCSDAFPFVFAKNSPFYFHSASTEWTINDSSKNRTSHSCFILALVPNRSPPQPCRAQS